MNATPKPSSTPIAPRAARSRNGSGPCATWLLAFGAASLALAGCQFGPPPDQVYPPVPESKQRAIVPAPRGVEYVSLDARGQDWPIDAEVVAPQSKLGKAATQTTGLTLLKRQMVTLSANLPANTNGYRLEKAQSETSQWQVIANFATNKFTYQDLNLQNPIWLYRAVPVSGPPVPPPKLASKQLWWDASPTAGVTNYVLKWGTNVLRTPLLTATASNLVSGSTVSFTIAARGAGGESAPAKAVSYTVP